MRDGEHRHGNVDAGMRRKPAFRRYLPGFFALLFIASVGVGAALMIRKFMAAEPAKTERKIQTITVVPNINLELVGVARRHRSVKRCIHQRQSYCR